MRSLLFICALVFLGGLSTGCPDSVEDDPSDSWHDAYVADHCDRCPECCVSDADMDAAGEDASDHCSDCPGEECLCIQDTDGNWVLSPEVGSDAAGSDAELPDADADDAASSDADAIDAADSDADSADDTAGDASDASEQ